ncbi:MAG: hypothetical protein CFE34_04900 [Rhodobacteraceae bacterium PARR1]|nr:MAG: hypothetical protein CFE34_04900 [Rhodobacteraceae bacterium PARR1]
MKGVALVGLWLVAWVLAGPATAQTRSVTEAMAALPPDVAERIAARPDRWRDMALGMVHGHGRDGALVQADLDRAAALDRAYFRARALQPLIEADLDNDGAVTQAEAAARGGVLGLTARARLMLTQAAADGDADGTATAAELRAHAEAAALQAGQGAEAALAAALMGLDLDGDGRLTLAEVGQVADSLATATAQAG